MKIAIMGAGMTGAYLYRLLRRKGFRVDIFETGSGTRCGLSPCAWGTSRGFKELVTASGLAPAKYVLKVSDHVMMDGLWIKGDLMTFDKQRLIKDLLRGARVQHRQPETAQYDRVIDATGASRAFLPPVDDDITMSCVQRRVRTDAPLGNQIKLGRIGYAWCFPLSDNEYHIGCGSLISDPRMVLKELGWWGKSGSSSHTVCACTGKVRLTGPHHSQPFVSLSGAGDVWGVGEAIGCVAPLAGDGIVPGMRSVQILLEWWNNPARYTRAILKEFQWMKYERGVVDKLSHGQPLGLKDAWVLKKNSRRMGMQVGVKESVTLLKHLL